MWSLLLLTTDVFLQLTREYCLIPDVFFHPEIKLKVNLLRSFAFTTMFV